MASFQRLPDRFDPWFVCSPMEVSLCHSGGWSRLCGTMVHTGQVWGWASAVVSGPKTWICGIAIGWMTWSFLSKFGGFHFFHLTITSWPREVMLFAPPLGQLKSQKEAWQRILDNKNIYIYMLVYIHSVYMYIYTLSIWDTYSTYPSPDFTQRIAGGLGGRSFCFWVAKPLFKASPDRFLVLMQDVQNWDCEERNFYAI